MSSPLHVPWLEGEPSDAERLAARFRDEGLQKGVIVDVTPHDNGLDTILVIAVGSDEYSYSSTPLLEWYAVGLRVYRYWPRSGVRSAFAR